MQLLLNRTNLSYNGTCAQHPHYISVHFRSYLLLLLSSAYFCAYMLHTLLNLVELWGNDAGSPGTGRHFSSQCPWRCLERAPSKQVGSAPWQMKCAQRCSKFNDLLEYSSHNMPFEPIHMPTFVCGGNHFTSGYSIAGMPGYTKTCQDRMDMILSVIRAPGQPLHEVRSALPMWNLMRRVDFEMSSH